MLFAEREQSEATPARPSHPRVRLASSLACRSCLTAPPPAWRPSRTGWSARCVRCVPAFSLRSSCTPIHLPTRTTGGGHDGPKSPVTLRVHAPRFRLRRRLCSHLRRTPCDQDDQPADKAGASHAGAHDGRCALPWRAACINSRAPSIPGCVPSVRASRVMSQTKYLTFCKPDTLTEICAAHKPDLRCKTVTRASIQALYATCPARLICMPDLLCMRPRRGALTLILDSDPDS